MSSKIFEGLIFSCSGLFAGLSLTTLAKLIKDNGGDFGNLVNQKTTHLITTDEEVSHSSFKVTSAIKHGVFVVNLNFIYDSISSGAKLAEADYFIGSKQPTSSKVSTSSKVIAYPSVSKTPSGFNPKMVKCWKVGDSKAPNFPSEYDVVKNVILQCTMLMSNNNKYYGLEMHRGLKTNGDETWRLFTHYGRTDDLEANPQSGQKECRYVSTKEEAESVWEYLYSQKTSDTKGYKPVSLSTSKIGSEKAKELYGKSTSESTSTTSSDSSSESSDSSLSTPLRELVETLFDEATTTLLSTLNAKITEHGIETPLGVLDISQVKKGESILEQILVELKKGDTSHLEKLSSEFYSAIPHRLGKSKVAVKEAIINSLVAYEKKADLLQLMKDMLAVNSSGALTTGVFRKYTALKCLIKDLPSFEFQKVKQFVEGSQVKSESIEVVNAFALQKNIPQKFLQGEQSGSGNVKLLFHGSRASNFVGLLSRGLLMPKIVVSRGGARTDAGMLGNGIYFGDAADTSSAYTTESKKGTRFMLLARVALGRVKDYTKFTQGLETAPPGFDSVHGVRAKAFESDFKDDEYVIFDVERQRQDYLIEFRTNPSPTSIFSVPVAHEEPSIPQLDSDSPVPLVTSSFSFERETAPTTFSTFSENPTTLPKPNNPFVKKEVKHPNPEKTNPGTESDPFAQLMTAEQLKLKQKEDYFRSLFATDPSHRDLQNPYVHLMNVYSNFPQFHRQEEDAEETKIGRVFSSFKLSEAIGAPSIVRTVDDFHQNFKLFSGGQLQGLNWDNVFVAGGSVLSCLDSKNPAAITSNSSPDIDIFLWGLSEEQAKNKIKHIYQVVSQNRGAGTEPPIIRTSHAITIIGSHPTRHIQIILRLYKSPAEILMGFDLDCCAVGTNGESVWALPRSQRAITKRYNLIDLSRRSLTYEIRLFKYAKRGYEVAVPGLDPQKILSGLWNKRPREVSGLAKLLLFEKRDLSTEQSQPQPQRPGLGMRKKFSATDHIKKSRKPKAGKPWVDPIKVEEKTTVDKESESDYSENVFVPWGPGWSSVLILRTLTSKDKAKFFATLKGERKHEHIFVSGLENVLEGRSSWCKICSKSGGFHVQEKPKPFSVLGPLKFLSQDPGRQLLTGSFHPLSSDRWFDDAFGPGTLPTPASSFSTLSNIKPNPTLVSTSSTGASQFGGTSSVSLSPSKGLFGGPTTSTVSSSGLFATSSIPNPSSKSLFGASSGAQSSGLFGGPTSSAVSSTGLFGGPTSSTVSSSSSSGLFSTSSIPLPSSTSLFGGPPSDPPSSSLFGGQTLFSGFSSAAPSSTVPSSTVFGFSSAPQNVSTNLFGTVSSQASTQTAVTEKPKSGKKGKGAKAAKIEERSPVKAHSTSYTSSTSSTPQSSPFKSATSSTLSPSVSKTTPSGYFSATSPSAFGGPSSSSFASPSSFAISEPISSHSFAEDVSAFQQPSQFVSEPLFQTGNRAGEAFVTDLSAFGGPSSTLSELSVSSHQGQSTSSQRYSQQDSQSLELQLQKVFKSSEGPRTPTAKLFLLLSMLYKGGKISTQVKDVLKELIINGDTAPFSSLEVFEIDQDFDELADTLRRICAIKTGSVDI